MGTLIIIEAPSCTGKGPLLETLEVYLEDIRKKYSINITLKKHVLYNTREKKESEVHGETYWYSYLWDTKNNQWYKNIRNIAYDKNIVKSNLKEIKKEANKLNQRFDIFKVREDKQGLNFAVLKEELKNNDIVLLEIFQEKVDDVIVFCNNEGIDLNRIFISPLSDDEYVSYGCTLDEAGTTQRSVITEITMLGKLTRRGRDSVKSNKKRAKTAAKEIENARALRGTKDFIYMVNHFGEDMKQDWVALQKRIKSNKYDYYFENYKTEIDNTFRQFLESVFSRHVCGKYLNVCTCMICGCRQHGKKYNSEGNYGSGCGAVTETCERCGAWERYDDATGNIISRSPNW